MKKDGIYVIDFDDVLVYLAKSVYHNIRAHWRVFNKYFWNPGSIGINEIYSRKMFNVNEWLIANKFINLTSAQYSSIQLEIMKLVKEYCFKYDIYSDIELTDFAKTTVLNPMFLDNPVVKRVYIISRSITDEQAKSKEEFINRYFSHPKFTYIPVGEHESKYEAIKKLNISFDVFIDDEIPNIRDVAEHIHDLTGKEFIIPKYGYNKMPQELKFLIESRGGSISYINDPNVQITEDE